MDKKKDLLYFIEKLTGLEEFWKINYYLRAMKKAPHGGVVRMFQPNIYLKHYPFQAWTFMCHDPESIPHFMIELVDKAIELYTECADVDLEELLQYCFNGDNWYMGFRLLHIKPEYDKLNEDVHGTLLWSILDKKQRITDFFNIQLKYALYSLVLCLVQEKMILINSVDDILAHENLRNPHNKYGLSKLDNAEFFRQGFRIEEIYYLYNIFLDPTIGSPLDEMPYTMRILTEEIQNAEIFMRCDNNLAQPFDKKISTATVDAQKYHGITVDFANIESLIHNKEIIVHIHPELLHKIILIIKPDVEDNATFYHIEVEQLWNPEIVKDDIILANYIHAKYFPCTHGFKHIDFSVNQYNINTYKAKYAEMVNDTGIPIDKYGDQHYKIWCVEADNISVLSWSKLVCATLDEPFRELFLETFKQEKKET